MMDRTTAPPLNEIQAIGLPAVEKLTLGNGIPVWRINAGTQEVIKIELLFDAGRMQEPLRAVASATAKMLAEGTQKRSAKEMAEQVEFYGATFNADAAIDFASVSLFSLNKHLPSLLPLLQEVLEEASFPEKELSTYLQNSRQRLLVNLEKVDFLAHKEFNERVYGAQHPNGYTTAVADYDQLNTEVLTNFYRQRYYGRPFKVIVSGKVADASIRLIDQYLGKKSVTPFSENGRHEFELINSPGKFYVEKKEAVQSAIRIGSLTANKLHPDFPKLRVMNTLLGGYFGSRLMQNLREDKGYCYGIHSSIASYVNHASFYITTEVGKEVAAAAAREIYLEIDRLHNETVSLQELQVVKNYLLGVMLADADGPFNVSEIVRSLVIYGLDETHFHNLVNGVKTITPGEVRALARKYLVPETMTEVVAGTRE
jgi:predicted Zn-dependent peptidase